MPLSYVLGASSITPIGLGYRNILNNGAMQVHQRGTSASAKTTAGYYTADRWQVDIGTLGTWTQTIENDAPTGSGFRKSLKMLCTTADASPASGDVLAVVQRIEGQNLQRIKKGTSSAEQLTVSFWVKANVTGTYVFELYDNDNTRQCSATYTIVSTNTWEKKTITLPADTTGAFDNDNALSLYVIWWLSAGSLYTGGTLNTTWASVTSANRAAGQTNLASATNNYWQITGAQLEVGAVATAFEFKSYGDELLECQRYAQVINEPKARGVIAGANLLGRMGFALATTMRISPVLEAYSGTLNIYDGSGVGTITSLSVYWSTPEFAEFDATLATGSLIGGRPAIVYDGDQTGTFTLSADL